MNENIFITYMNLRKGIVYLTFLLPILLIGYGFFIDVDLQNSLSSYYHAFPEAYSYNDFHSIQKGQILRTLFVGILFAVGSLLYLYKGFNPKENIALNLAGGFAILVAMFPTQGKGSDGNVIFEAVKFGDMFSLHGLAAALLVFCVAYVCVCRPANTVELLDDENLRKKFDREYKILGTLMIILPISIFVYLSLLKNNDQLVLWVEIAVLVVFARFWWTKNKELNLIDPEKLLNFSKSYLDTLSN